MNEWASDFSEIQSEAGASESGDERVHGMGLPGPRWTVQQDAVRKLHPQRLILSIGVQI
jgi:hypothetical protein